MTPATELLDRHRFEIKMGDYGVGTAQALADPSILAKTQDYRRQTGSRMMPLGKSDIRAKVPTADYHVSPKVDGEFAVLVLRNSEIFSINPGGTVLYQAWVDQLVADGYELIDLRRTPAAHD